MLGWLIVFALLAILGMVNDACQPCGRIPHDGGNRVCAVISCGPADAPDARASLVKRRSRR